MEVEFPFSVTERGVLLKPSAKAEAVLPTNHDDDGDVPERVIGLAHGATATGELAAQVAQTRGRYGQLHELGASTPSVNIAGADGRLRVLADQTDDLVQAGLCKWIDGAPSAGTTPSAKEAEPPPPDGSAGGTTRGGRRMLKAARKARQSAGRGRFRSRGSNGTQRHYAQLHPGGLWHPWGETYVEVGQGKGPT